MVIKGGRVQKGNAAPSRSVARRRCIPQCFAAPALQEVQLTIKISDEGCSGRGNTPLVPIFLDRSEERGPVHTATQPCTGMQNAKIASCILPERVTTWCPAHCQSLCDRRRILRWREKIIENLLAENHLHVQARLCVCLCIRQCQVRTIPIFLDRSEGTLHRGIIVVRHPCWALLRESLAKMVTSVRVAIAANNDW